MKVVTKTKLHVLLYFSFLFNQQLICQNNVDVINFKCLPQNYHPAPSNYLNSKQDCSNALAVPSYLWSYGCLPTSAAMILGYYDRTGYSCCYTGTINGGLAPFMNNKIFPPDPNASYLLCKNPMSASVKGFDGRTINGHVDDFWVSYGSSGNDPHPWIGNTPPRDFTISPCAADYMGSNQDYWNTSDFNTQLMLFSSGVKTIDYTGMENSTPRVRDGNHGLRLLFEELGYTVLENYNQYIRGQAPNSTTAGFTFDEYKAEIDAGRPVIILITNNSDYHAMVGHGYNTCNGKQTLWVLDTWNDYSTFMDWGGTYQGMYLYGVSVIKLSPLSKSSGTCVAPPVGINDIVKIMNPPQGSPYPPNTLNFALGSTANFYAKFTSNEGNTYPTSWSWTIDLYHDSGSYTLASNNFNAAISDCPWTPTVSTTIPNYSWIRDENGNISGKVTITVHINDGDYKSDNVRVSVNSTPIPSPPTNFTSSSTNYCSTSLTWSASSGATSYKVYNSTSTPATLISTTTATSYMATGLSAGTLYKFYVTAVGSSGESNPSSTLSITTPSNPTPIISSSPAYVCSSGVTFTVSNLPSGCSVIWGKSANVNLSSASGNSATFVANGSGTGWVNARFSSGCGNSPVSPNTVFLVGSPTPSIVASQISASGEPTTVEFTATAYSNATYNWYVNGILQQNEINKVFDLYFPCRVTKTVKCSLTNFCGTSAFSNSIGQTGECVRALSYSVSPNPASSMVTLTVVSLKTLADSALITYSSFDFVRVFDLQGNLKKFLKYSKTINASINIADLKRGVYIFEIGNNEYTEKHQVIINK